MDAFELIAKLNAIPYEEIRPHLGKHVAWSPAAEIIASAPNLEKLYELLDARGVTDYIIDYLPDEPPERSSEPHPLPRRHRTTP